MTEFTVPSDTFTDFWNVAAAEIFEALTEMIFYGILLVLVAFAGSLLARRRNGRELLYATGVMLVLATLQLAFRLCAAEKAAEMLYLRVEGAVAPEDPRAVRAAAQNLLFNFLEDVLLVTNNLVTDGVLIYRCWLIWDSNYYAVIAPTLMLLLTTVLSYLSAVQGDYPRPGGPTVDLRIGFLLGVVTNIVIVGLTVGRILHTRRRARTLGLQGDLVRKYSDATAMLLESGGLICAWVVVYILLRSMNVPPTVWRVFRGGLAQLLNIAPTLIVVRVGLGHAISGKSTVGAGSSATQTTTTLHSKSSSFSAKAEQV